MRRITSRLVCLSISIPLVCFFGCVRDLRPQASSDALYAFERETAFMVDSGNLRGAQGRIEAFFDTSAVPTSDYARRVHAYLLLRLGYTYYAQERWPDVQAVYARAGPYLPYADTLPQIRFYRWASTAYAKAGNRNTGLTMIHRSMYLADAAGDSIEFEKSRACWRALAADTVITALPVETSRLALSVLAAVVILALVAYLSYRMGAD